MLIFRTTFSERPGQDLWNGVIFDTGILHIVEISTRENPAHPSAMTPSVTVYFGMTFVAWGLQQFQGGLGLTDGSVGHSVH